ncbi:PadR family transcriptional regulator [Azospirillum sp. B4]|uniref:PadR family transcriptional regulator n=1 Tax=Azospirillum sp. B4 TaxID=95605 RepID=UPI00034D7A07|nr:PadR family transcriptional regulator [Azospirillum sp. B4]
MDVSSWQTQLRKGAAELVVLAILGRGEAYGLEILAAAEAVVSEGALYPLLNRLERDGKLTARWSLDAGVPHPRKYYALTPAGQALLTEMRGVWKGFRQTLTALVEKGIPGEGGDGHGT